MQNSTAPLKPCRTLRNNIEVPCDVATKIERHDAMLTPANLAVLLAVSVKSVYAWVKAGTLPAVTLGASIRFDPATTARWLRDRSV
jgi:excisionase family DNA binding protein